MVDEKFISEFPEINLENYDVVDVERLNGWAIEAAAALAMAIVEIRTLQATKIELGPKLFSFKNFTDWCDHAQGAWKAAGVSSRETLCIDQKGRVCGWGKHFMTAQGEDAFPVDVYLMRTDLQQNAGNDPRSRVD